MPTPIPTTPAIIAMKLPHFTRISKAFKEADKVFNVA